MPDGFGLLTQTELELALGKSRATVTRWRKEGLPVFEVRKRRLFFDLKAVKAWIRKSGIDGRHGGDRTLGRIGASSKPKPAAKASRPKPEPAPVVEGELELEAELEGLDAGEIELLRIDHLKARIRKEKAMADKHELEVAKRRGELVERELVAFERIARVNYARAVLLGGPGILAGDLIGLGVEDIEERLGAWVRQALGHLGPAS